MQVLCSYAENHVWQDILQPTKFFGHRKKSSQDDSRGSLVFKADWSFCTSKDVHSYPAKSDTCRYICNIYLERVGAQLASVAWLYLPFSYPTHIQGVWPKYQLCLRKSKLSGADLVWRRSCGVFCLFVLLCVSLGTTKGKCSFSLNRLNIFKCLRNGLSFLPYPISAPVHPSSGSWIGK